MCILDGGVADIWVLGCHTHTHTHRGYCFGVIGQKVTGPLRSKGFTEVIFLKSTCID